MTKKNLILVGLLILAVLYFLNKNNPGSPSPYLSTTRSIGGEVGSTMPARIAEQSAAGGPARDMAQTDGFTTEDSMSKRGIIAPYDPAAPNAPTADRIIIKNGSMSLVVKDVVESRSWISSYVEGLGGYVVSVDMSQPADNLNASLTLRVPAPQFDTALGEIRKQGLKVSYENVSSQDVTDEFIDLEAQLKSDEATLTQFTELLKRANTVDEILRVQSEMNRIQTQIDSTKGRMEYLEKSGQFALLTVYLATDEGELPYLPPSEKWRPDVAFKSAVRSLANGAKDISYALIHLAVYSVVIIPVVLILVVLKRNSIDRKNKK